MNQKSRYGNREALRRMVGVVTRTNNDVTLRQLRRVIPYDGTDEAFVGWLGEHWKTLTWNDGESEWR